MVPINERVNAASILLNFYNWKTHGEHADALIARIEPWLADPRLTPKSRVWWHVHRAFNEQIRGRYARAQRLMKDTEAFAAAHGLKWVQFEIYHAEVTALAASDDAAAAAAALAKLRTVLDPARRMDVAYFRFQETGVLMLQDRPREAAAAAADAVAIGRESGLPPLQIPHFLVRLALCNLRSNEIAAALTAYGEAISLASGPTAATSSLHERLVHAFACCATATSRRHRTAAFAAAHVPRIGVFRLPAPGPQVLSPVLALALAEGIERDYVRTLIRRRKLPPPSPDVADWPWPLALRTLGEFAIVRDGVSHGFEGQGAEEAARTAEDADRARRTQRRRGDDHRLAVAGRRGRRRQDFVRQQPLSAAQAARVDGALQLAEGKLSLNADLVWLDVWAFEPRAGRRCRRGRAWRCIADTSWRSRRRRRGCCRFATGCSPGSCARCSPAARRSSNSATGIAARALYERALEVDNLAEAVYRRLMVCLRESGDSAARSPPTGAAANCCRSCSVDGRRPIPKRSARRSCKRASAICQSRGSRPFGTWPAAPGAAPRDRASACNPSLDAGWRRPGGRASGAVPQPIASVSDPSAPAREDAAIPPHRLRHGRAGGQMKENAMHARDMFGPPDTDALPALPAALATPFAWPPSGLEPMPWFPFTVAASRGHAATAARIAQRTERAYWYLRTPAWLHPALPAAGARARRLAALCRGAELRLSALHRRRQPRGRQRAGGGLARRQPRAGRIAGPGVARALREVLGADPVHPAGPDLTASRRGARRARTRAPRRRPGRGALSPRRGWPQAFANYALVAVLGETEPAALRRLGALAEAAATLAAQTPQSTEYEAADGTLDAVRRPCSLQLALTRARVPRLRASAGRTPLVRWFAQRLRRAAPPSNRTRPRTRPSRSLATFIRRSASCSWLRSTAWRSRGLSQRRRRHHFRTAINRGALHVHDPQPRRRRGSVPPPLPAALAAADNASIPRRARPLHRQDRRLQRLPHRRATRRPAARCPKRTGCMGDALGWRGDWGTTYPPTFASRCRS